LPRFVTLVSWLLLPSPPNEPATFSSSLLVFRSPQFLHLSFTDFVYPSVFSVRPSPSEDPLYCLWLIFGSYIRPPQSTLLGTLQAPFTPPSDHVLFIFCPLRDSADAFNFFLPLTFERYRPPVRTLHPPNRSWARHRPSNVRIAYAESSRIPVSASFPTCPRCPSQALRQFLADPTPSVCITYGHGADLLSVFHCGHPPVLSHSPRPATSKLRRRLAIIYSFGPHFLRDDLPPFSDVPPISFCRKTYFF